MPVEMKSLCRQWFLHTQRTLQTHFFTQAFPSTFLQNVEGLGMCYPPQPSAWADNTNLGLENSRYHAKTVSNNC